MEMKILSFGDGLNKSLRGGNMALYSSGAANEICRDCVKQMKFWMFNIFKRKRGDI